MIRRLAIASLLALPLMSAPVVADEYATFATCAAAAASEDPPTPVHHCTAALVQHCGSSTEAWVAAACIKREEDALEVQITAEVAVLAEQSGDPVETVEDALLGERSSGASACRLMAERDASSGVASGQTAVNEAFCRLISTGDVYALVLKLKEDE